jgi:hypothetical protein
VLRPVLINRNRKLLFGIVVVTLVVAVLLLVARDCPDAGFALTRHVRALHRLKNRTAPPQETDFDTQVTLQALLQPGNDSSRWLVQRAARVEGYVIDVAYARPEATNCYLPCRRDIHIVIADKKAAPPNEQIVVEVTPNSRQRATSQGRDWSEKTLRAQLLGHRCAFEGWLYFDEGHDDQSENTSPNNPTNWRATAWEIHPVTRITVVD